MRVLTIWGQVGGFFHHVGHGAIEARPFFSGNNDDMRKGYMIRMGCGG